MSFDLTGWLNGLNSIQMNLLESVQQGPSEWAYHWRICTQVPCLKLSCESHWRLCQSTHQQTSTVLTVMWYKCLLTLGWFYNVTPHAGVPFVGE